jgi:hypothetical protein
MSNRYVGSNISPFANGRQKICHTCAALLPQSQVVEVHPVPGLTMYRCQNCTALLQRILAYAKERWCWDDASLLEELFVRENVDTTPEAAVDAWARDLDLTDPRDLGVQS